MLTAKGSTGTHFYLGTHAFALKQNSEFPNPVESTLCVLDSYNYTVVTDGNKNRSVLDFY